MKWEERGAEDNDINKPQKSYFGGVKVSANPPTFPRPKNIHQLKIG